MRFLTVADRELRAAAKRKATYRVRWITAVVFFGLLVWLLWALDGFTRRGAAMGIFQVYSILSFVYCIIIGTSVTADCLSAERREGTLGLLFLTNLNSVEIVAGKFCSTALTAVYGLAAIFPMLALPLLMGGITLAHFWKTILALVVTTFFSMSAGFVASVICRRQFLAIAVALGLGFLFGVGLMGAAEAVHAVWKQITWADELAAFCPFYSLLSADGARLLGTNYYWFSLLAVTGVALIWLALVTWWLARTWRDRPRRARGFIRLPTWKRWRWSGSAGRVALRRRLLNINPFFWLGGRRVVSSPAFMMLSVVLVATGALVAAPFFSRTMTPGGSNPVVGYLFGWLWTGAAIHLMTAYFAAMAASQRLAEDKQTGALELILSTPTSERTISRGLWLAFARRMLFPALLATLVHFFFIWQFFTAIAMEMPGWIGRGLSKWQVFWRALLQMQMSEDSNHWQLGFTLRCLLLALALSMLAWITLGWVGRWLGLRMKHPGFAPVVSLALVYVPPTILFSIACYVADELQFDQWPDRQFSSCMMWLAVVIGVVHCVSLAGWARGHLRRDFRTEVMSRFQPTLPVQWWRIILRLLRRVAIGVGVSAAALLLIILLFYGYQNWRGQRRWAAFERQLKQQGQSLDFSRPLPKPVPDEANFARSPAFQTLLNRTDSLAKLSENLRLQSVSYPGAPQYANLTLAWNSQQFLPLADAAALLNSASPRSPMALRPYNSQMPVDSNRTDAATDVLRGLEPFEAQMSALALSAKRPFFQIATNRAAFELLDPRHPGLEALEKAQRLFLLRASAALEVNRTAIAADDVLTSLRLAGLARQSSDIRSTHRAQGMLTAVLQPFWEGIIKHQWTESQLVSLQMQLAEFDLLSDYTNAVPRATLAYIESWQAASRSKRSHSSVPIIGGYASFPMRPWQPRAWWLDNCIQLHQAGQSAIARMDVAAGRIAMQVDWSNLRGLPLDADTQILLQQPSWQGANPSLVAFAQSAVNQAVIACALERHLLTRGQYPETLEAVRREFPGRIPNDPVRGRPMSYERVNDRQYILRSFGPNEVDDRKNRASDDWLWSFPTNAAAVK
jgi:hypothetical protein